MVFKLDFRKAFDFVSWVALDKILKARGFCATFRGRVSNILCTRKTMILLKGTPKNWITCRNGLRQSDSLSPYLFLIINDHLQQLILQSQDLLNLHHPIFSHLPPTMLHYANDNCSHILPQSHSKHFFSCHEPYN